MYVFVLFSFGPKHAYQLPILFLLESRTCNFSLVHSWVQLVYWCLKFHTLHLVLMLVWITYHHMGFECSMSDIAYILAYAFIILVLIFMRLSICSRTLWAHSHAIVLSVWWLSLLKHTVLFNLYGSLLVQFYFTLNWNIEVRHC